MLPALLLFVADTTAGPTVGDTLWVTRTVALPAGTMIRPRPLRSQEPVEPLGPPEVTLVGDSARIRYPVVAWEPGRHAILAPGAILIREDGWSDTLVDWRTSIDVASVLPAGPRDSLAPREAAPPIPREPRTLRPLLVCLALALLALVPLHLAWHRRRPAPPLADPPTAEPGTDRLRQWAAQGEWSAAIEGWRYRLREAPGPEAARLRAELEAARFGPCPPEVAQALVRRAEAWEAGA